MRFMIHCLKTTHTKSIIEFEIKMKIPWKHKWTWLKLDESEVIKR